MNALKALLSFRPLNLILVFVAQMAAYQRLYVDVWDFGTANEPSLSLTVALLLATSSTLMMLFGNLHNDWVDFDKDQNFGKKNSLQFLPQGHFVITLMAVVSLLAIGITFLPSVYSVFPASSLIVLGSGLLLVAYNLRLKCIPFIGNFLVAGLSAFGGLFAFWIALWVTEPVTSQEQLAYSDIWLPGLVYLTFSFILNLIREIVKDIEDTIPDSESGCRTIANSVNPIIQKVFILLLVGLLLIIGLRVVVGIIGLREPVVVYYLIFILILITIVGLMALLRLYPFSKWISVLLKIILFLGVTSLLWLPFEKLIFYGF
jgi:4-hydroxybenzoate polyprenyltransferase